MLEICIVIPTLNEAANVAPLLPRLERTLRGLDWEVIFVDDDSIDGTAGLVRRISRINPRVRAMQRIGRRGLSSACVEGMLAPAAPVVAVMDGDLQHDDSILPAMLEKLRREDLDVVVGSRHVDGGSIGDFAWHRRVLSDAGKWMSTLVCGCEIQDPMSGFFIAKRSIVESAARNMSTVGFKILVDLISSTPSPPRVGEFPYRFGERQHGESKLETTVLLDFGYLIADKLVGKFIPFRFLLFGMAGLGGLVLHVAILAALLFGNDFSFLYAQTVATVAAMVVNYLLNNWFTFRDRRRKGWGILGGLGSFCLACSVGALANLAIAELLYTRGVPWYLAGALGTLVGAVWNFSVTSIFTWREERLTIGRAETAERAAIERWEELCATRQEASLVGLARALEFERSVEGTPGKPQTLKADDDDGPVRRGQRYVQYDEQ